MAMNVENKNEITFEEFRAWMTGLIRGKRGSLPDLEDWKQIKIMMDKVEEGKKYQDFPLQPPHTPPFFIDPPPFVNKPWYNPYPIWCDTSSDNINFGDLNIDIPEINDPNIGTVANITLTGTPQTNKEFEQNVKEYEEAQGDNYMSHREFDEAFVEMLKSQEKV